MTWGTWRAQRRLRKQTAMVSGHASRAILLLVPFVPVLLLILSVPGSSSEDGARFNTVFWGIVCALIASVFVLFQIEKARARRFLLALHRHRDELRTGSASILGQTLSRASEVVQYELCVSMFILYAGAGSSLPQPKSYVPVTRPAT